MTTSVKISAQDSADCSLQDKAAAVVSKQSVARSASKRIFDLSVSYVLLVATFPLMALIAILIKSTSRGPVLFRQQRLGRFCRPFYVYKFRTMVCDAEARLSELEASNESNGGILFKMRRDPRVTTVGKFLRKSSLDELPQLWNVLMGEMSLVGPRPLPKRDLELLERVDPEGYLLRHTVLPGLTGLWQIGGRSDVGHESMIRLDLEYVEHASFALDFTILAKTVSVVLLGKGAC